jgi:Ca-activated chloride channel homolog
MHFAHPQLLLLLLVPVAIAAWSLAKPGVAVAAPVGRHALTSQPFTMLLLKAGQVFPTMVLACFIVLLARPLTEQEVLSRNPVQKTNIEILLNASRSMLAESEIGHHCRYCASKVAIGDFVKQRNGNSMGISIFGSRHLDLVPLTADLNCVVASIAETYPDWIAYQIAHEKNFEEGLARSVEKLAVKARPDSEQILILVTDGENQELAAHEEGLRKRLAENRVTLYVAMIAEGGNSRVLARLAEETKGGLFECRDAMGFFEAMRHIDRMNRIVYQDSAPRPVDNSWWVLLVIVATAFVYAVHLATPFRPTPW